MTIQAATRKFGVEIECIIPNEFFSMFPAGDYHRGQQIEWMPEGWNCQYDGSIRVHKADHFGVEIVSPPLAGEEGLVQMVYMLDCLVKCRAKINKSCGFHVHVDAGDLVAEQIQTVTQSFINLEDSLFRLCGRQAGERFQNHYCKRSADWGDGYADRYRSLNLSNYYHPSGLATRQGKRTIEFRLFTLGGKIDPKRAVSLVYTAVSLVVRSVNRGVIPSIPGEKYEQSKVWVNETFRDEDCRIIPDGPVWDIVGEMYRSTKKATV